MIYKKLLISKKIYNFYNIFIIFWLYLYYTSNIIIILKIFIKNRKLFHLLPYNNEEFTLLQHITKLYDYVDYFVLTWNSKSNSGNLRNFSFGVLESEILKYKDKIILCKIVNDNFNKPWEREKYNRNYGLTCLKKKVDVNENDIIYMGDLDEIPSYDCVKEWLKFGVNKVMTVSGRLFYFNYCRLVGKWNAAAIFQYSKNLSNIDKYRYMNKKKYTYYSKKGKPCIDHCSYCFNNPEEIARKFNSSAHTEFKKYPYINNSFGFYIHYCKKNFRGLKKIKKIKCSKENVPFNSKYFNYLIDDNFIMDKSKTIFANYSKKNLKNICKKKIYNIK